MNQNLTIVCQKLDMILENKVVQKLKFLNALLQSLTHKGVATVVMSPSWNFPARAEPSYEGSEPSRAKLGHFNFRAESELKIPTKYHNFFQPFFPPSFHYQILLVYHVPKKFCDHLLANKVFLELVALYELYILDAYLF